MRVYALAKQLGMENRDLIPELKRMGITVASHSSVLDDDVVQKVLEKLGPKLKAPGREVEADAAGRGERRKSGLVSEVGVRGGSPQAPSTDEASKSDKRRILIKRKRVDETFPEGASSLPVIESAGASGAHIDFPATSQPPALQSEIPSVTHVDPSATPDQPHAIGTLAPTVPATPVKLPVVPSVDVLSGKKKALSLEEMQAEGLKEKGKKARKPGRTREEEELRIREDAARWQDLGPFQCSSAEMIAASMCTTVRRGKSPSRGERASN